MPGAKQPSDSRQAAASNQIERHIIREAVFGENGFTTRLAMSPVELAEFRGLITEHWLARIGEQYPAPAVAQFRDAGLEKYHRLADRVDHKGLWPKTARLLPEAAVARIRRMDFMRTLAAEFGDFGISNEEEIHPEEIYWRIVRPGMAATSVRCMPTPGSGSSGTERRPPTPCASRSGFPFTANRA